MGKKSSPAKNERGDKSALLGEQQETITIELSDAEVELERARVMDLLGRKANLEQARAASQAEYKAKIKRVDGDIAEACKAATTRKRETTVVVEEYLRGTQVLRVRADTGEVLGQRAATSGERQESMFDDAPADRFPAEPFGEAV